MFLLNCFLVCLSEWHFVKLTSRWARYLKFAQKWIIKHAVVKKTWYITFFYLIYIKLCILPNQSNVIISKAAVFTFLSIPYTFTQNI